MGIDSAIFLADCSGTVYITSRIVVRVKVAPKHLLGLCQGLWLGATAVGNLLLWIGPLMYNAIPIGYCWAIFMIVCLISMGVMLSMVKWLEKVAK